MERFNGGHACHNSVHLKHVTVEKSKKNVTVEKIKCLKKKAYRLNENECFPEEVSPQAGRLPTMCIRIYTSMTHHVVK